MKTFLFKIILFLLPISLIYIFPAMVMILGREYYTVGQVLERQRANPAVLFGFAYSSQGDYQRRLSMLEEKKDTDVMILGSSRVLQFRTDFFDPSRHFVNVGIGYPPPVELRQFVQALPVQGTSTILFLGIDREMFLRPTMPPLEDEVGGIVPSIRTVLMHPSEIYLNYLNKKFTIAELWNASRTSPNIGITSLIAGDGFRADGSYVYNRDRRNPDIAAWAKRVIDERVGSVQYEMRDTPEAGKLIDANVQIFADIVRICKERHITLVGYMTPYPGPIFSMMEKSSQTSHRIADELPVTLQQQFAQNGFTFFDFSSVSSFDGSEAEFIDEAHGSDLMNARVALAMAHQDPKLAQVFSVSALQDMITQHKGIFLSF